MRHGHGLTLAAAALAAATSVAAQPFGHHRPPPQSQPMDCSQLAHMPNAPMSLEACQAMAAQANAMQAVVDNPAGQRPGDEAMTCEAIKAEMASLNVAGPSREHLAEAEDAGRDFQARNARVQAEGTALAAAQSARTAAAAAASMTPVGGAVSTAVAASNAAEQAAFGAHAQAELAPAQNRMLSATATTMGDLAAEMQANPRFARLIQLGGRKNCH